MNMNIPKSFADLIGTEQKFSGPLFGRNKEIKPTKFSVIDVRFGSAVIIDMETLEDKHPTVELLLKNADMKQARWSRPFPCREIKLRRTTKRKKRLTAA